MQRLPGESGRVGCQQPTTPLFFNGFDDLIVVPGVAIVAPEELIKVGWTKGLKD